ncbi:hypothetical protein GOV11_01460 [Candidatus Woesearchaeota archaeon]|nr:hypothetical protein [Candidatus Woesearchaeota archaeon]
MTWENVNTAIEMILEDSTTSRAVREKIQAIQSYLETSDEDDQRKISSVLGNLEDMSSDVNLPPYVRTQLYSLSSELEAAGRGE